LWLLLLGLEICRLDPAIFASCFSAVITSPTKMASNGAAIGTSRPPLQSKFSESYTALLQGRQPWALDDASVDDHNSSSSSFQSRPAVARSKSAGKSNSGPRSRYFADLLCLPVETRLVADLLAAIPPEKLLDDSPHSQGARIADNVGALWREAIRVWRESDEDEVRRRNAVDTLVALSYPILTKRFSNYSFDLITIFAGGMDEADDVFTLLVDSIHDTLRGGDLARVRIPSSVRDDTDDADAHAAEARAWIDAEVQHRALQLGLLWLSCVAQTSLAAYFLRRDLFVTASAFASSPGGARYAYEGAVFLGLLATIGQGSAGGISLNVSTSNPYARRFRDWVDEQCMAKILLAAASAMDRDVQSYRQVVDDSPPSLAGSIAGLATMRWVSGFSELLGPAAPPLASDPKRKAASAASAVGADFSHLPSPTCVILLPLFLLSRSNQAFTSLILDTADQDESNGDTRARASDDSFCHLASLASYLATHASVSARSASYARISLLCLLVFLYDPRGSRNMLVDSQHAARTLERIRLCRQREPALALPRTKRTRLITAVLDVATCSLRYNLSKRIDTASYLISLRLVQRAVVLCSDERVQLEYDWHDCWSATLALASFLAARYTELRSSRDLPELIRALIATLNSILLRSDHFLPSTNEINHFVYELVRCSQTLRKTVMLLDPSSSRDAAGTPGRDADRQAAVGPTPPKLYAQVPGWKNIERVIQAVEASIADWVEQKPRSRRNQTPDINTITKLIAAIDREQLLAGATEDGYASASGPLEGANKAAAQAAMHHELEWLDRIQEQCLPEFVRHACADVLRILPVY
jgi:hypothetical protein